LTTWKKNKKTNLIMKKTSLLAVALTPLLTVTGLVYAQDPVSVATDPVGFVTNDLKQGTSLHGVPMVNPADLAGQGEASGDNIVLGGASVDFAASLGEGVRYYVEIKSPSDLAGHRFELDTAATRADTDNNLVINTGSANNTADLSALGSTSVTVLVRPHVTLGQLIDQWGAENHRAGDQLITFIGGAFTTYTYNVANSQWRVGPSNRNGDVIAPGVGFYFTRTSSDETAGVFIGEVRNNHFVQPLSSGIQIIAQGFPVDSSFAFAEIVGDTAVPQRNLLAGTVEQPSTMTPSAGDRVISFLNGTFTTYVYNAPNNQWRIGPGNQTNTKAFTATGALFIDLDVASPSYTMLNPVSQD
jgi:hypothetical protein